MEQDSRELLTVEQAAQYLQISQSSIRSYIRQGMLKAFRIAGKRKVLIPRAELLLLLEPARSEHDDHANGASASIESSTEIPLTGSTANLSAAALANTQPERSEDSGAE